jgi:AraC-like DNA-binding protein
MDALSDLIRSLRFSRAAFVMARHAALRSAPLPDAKHVVLYHLITDGAWRAESAHEAEPPLELAAGDLLVIPRADGHRVAARGPGGGILCGYLEVEQDLSGALLSALPSMFRVRLDGDPAAAWIEASMRFGVSETVQPTPGSTALLTSLAGSLFADAVRRHADTVIGERTGWLAALRDPLVGRALALLHDRPGDAWSVHDLARQVGTSRSVLAQRFVELVGESPMRYLAQRRLRLAALHLRGSDRALSDIASQVGYASEAAFNRAFKRELGAPPASWRRQARGARAA